MDCYKVLGHYFPDKDFYCEKDYESLIWLDISTSKPTKEEVENMYENAKDILKKQDEELEKASMLASLDLKEIVLEQQKQIQELQEQINKLSN